MKTLNEAAKKTKKFVPQHRLPVQCYGGSVKLRRKREAGNTPHSGQQRRRDFRILDNADQIEFNGLELSIAISIVIYWRVQHLFMVRLFIHHLIDHDMRLLLVF